MIRTRSPVVRLGIRAASPPAVMVGVYLLFAGHNQPGGGFAAGLVLGAVVALRTVAGLQRPEHGAGLVAGGVATMCAVAVLPITWGGTVLDQQIVSATLPVLGKMKTGTALPFDIGVTAVVIGLVIALLDGLGAAELGRVNQPSPASKGRPT